MKICFLWTLLLLFFLSACSSDDSKTTPHPVEKNSITGKLEKGPFTAGSKVTLYELNSNLSQTGKSYRTITTGDLGHFTFDSPISLSSQYAELEISGYFYDETAGELSDSQVTLNALVDLSDRSNVNVNLLTHLEYARVKKLIQGGVPFGQAKIQADKELLRVFSITDAISRPEDISLTDNTDEAGILLAVSAIMLYDRSEAEFTELVAKFATEFAATGTVSSDAVMRPIREGQAGLHPSRIVEDMKAYYTAKGTELAIKDFSRFVDFNGDGVIDDNDKESENSTSEPSDDLFVDENSVQMAISALYLEGMKTLTHQLYLEAARTRQLEAGTNGLFTPQSAEMETLWTEGWNTINRANYLLNYFKKNDLSFPTESYIAEAEAVRTFTYYNLTQLWGDLPLRDEHTMDSLNLPRKPKAEILRDLTERIEKAHPYLPDAAVQGKMSRWAASMLEAEIRLETGQYEEAAELLRNVLGCGLFHLSPNDNLYQDASAEVIFALWVAEGAHTDFAGTLQKGAFQPIYRYTSALLMFAEAQNRMNRPEKVRETLNRLGYEIAGETDTASLSRAIASLWKTRIGTDYGYWALLKRTGLAVSELGIQDYEQLFPIPQRELDFTSGWTQNPGYKK